MVWVLGYGLYVKKWRGSVKGVSNRILIDFFCFCGLGWVDYVLEVEWFFVCVFNVLFSFGWNENDVVWLGFYDLFGNEGFILFLYYDVSF